MQIETSRDTFKEASLDLLKGTGWKPGDKFSFHSVSELMVALALKVQKGEIGCDYPSCGCCADAACEDAINQHPDLGGTPPAPISRGIDWAEAPTLAGKHGIRYPTNAALAAFLADLAKSEGAAE